MDAELARLPVLDALVLERDEDLDGLLGLLLEVLHRQRGGRPRLPHAVPGHAGVDADRLVAVELVDVAGPEVLAVLEPGEDGGGEADDLALEADHALVGEVGAELLHEDGLAVVLGDWKSDLFI